MKQEDYNELIAKNMPQWQKDKVYEQQGAEYDAEIIAKLRTELTESKLLELSLGKRIENLVSNVDEHEAELAELKVENEKLKRLLKHPNLTKEQREANLDYNLEAIQRDTEIDDDDDNMQGYIYEVEGKDIKFTVAETLKGQTIQGEPV